jgi:HSP20 family molecular chaperone IbpA
MASLVLYFLWRYFQGGIGMSQVEVKTFQPFEPGADRLMKHITNVMDQIRCRAFELSTLHPKESLHDLDDWVQAENELLACQRCEVREEANHFVTEVDAAEFEPKDLKVFLLRNDLLIEGTSQIERKVGETEIENSGRSIKVRAFLPDAFDPASLKAELHQGVLRVTADKRHAETTGLPVERPNAALAAG